ncbi:hypothetical protein Patl1_10728 [Pistacia atlantica]|uniref:Uncharacterized protein n=1 Tax=Pistacia atlantica TaxID=434234 RepID=A0ACC1A1P6_9ROSI|nr:hypothetical protein Patl1_10728 [Pistacia atlantica]
MTWILGSVDPIIVLSLRPYKTAKSMWEYLKKVYNQDNIARHSQLEYEIASYTRGISLFRIIFLDLIISGKNLLTLFMPRYQKILSSCVGNSCAKQERSIFNEVTT